MSSRIAFTVHGRVQGVGFRDFTQRKASSYGLTGFVKNTSDDKVRLPFPMHPFDHLLTRAQVAGEAQGDEEALKKLKADLNEGPRSAHVVKVEVKDIETKSGEKSFDA
ncbi:hypothetical protein LTR10_022179 [Elasticomyces elasticus]|uniref:acylphosphatase n=1 Tax=Exophiala sideris TaxID=1016849 RepID=A0ABR0IWU2_9EURO|nr:hypothetical protein LTR10_022179 [Elasticomyces elasticus]KAK5021179.1 hypothetical protein LTS07_011175 [Exophiala sideris]KAK5023794.1 hypothetical protein LTR13_011103 [Exophiala sideris]KAK5048873.1 hypothetical protein LTR69_011218 [Exophiala sideris]KAK5176337.1 hypothetical protein LTR44_011099 [Eurotiomycetes sp. CCFEE 6388]